MLLRWFVNLYDLEIVEEDAFLKWKEDITDAYPGKGKALFQVSHYKHEFACKIRGFHVSDYEECHLLGCYAAWLI
jgi:hypothetical protein